MDTNFQTATTSTENAVVQSSSLPLTGCRLLPGGTWQGEFQFLLPESSTGHLPVEVACHLICTPGSMNSGVSMLVYSEVWDDLRFLHDSMVRTVLVHLIFLEQLYVVTPPSTFPLRSYALHSYLQGINATGMNGPRGTTSAANRLATALHRFNARSASGTLDTCDSSCAPPSAPARMASALLDVWVTPADTWFEGSDGRSDLVNSLLDFLVHDSPCGQQQRRQQQQRDGRISSIAALHALTLNGTPVKISVEELPEGVGSRQLRISVHGQEHDVFRIREALHSRLCRAMSSQPTTPSRTAAQDCHDAALRMLELAGAQLLELQHAMAMADAVWEGDALLKDWATARQRQLFQAVGDASAAACGGAGAGGGGDDGMREGLVSGLHAAHRQLQEAQLLLLATGGDL